MPRKVRGTVEGELAFGGSKVKAGQKLRAVADISDGRIQRKENGKRYHGQYGMMLTCQKMTRFSSYNVFF